MGQLFGNNSLPRLNMRGLHMNMHTTIKTPTPAEQQDSSLMEVTFSLGKDY